MDEIKHPNPYNVSLIELECPYEQFSDPVIRKLFSELLNMRKRGYSSRHRQAALPVDTYDFIGTHYLMVRGEGEEMQLLGGVRMVKRSQAQFYNLPLPVMSLLTSAKADRHLEFMQKFFARHETRDPNVDFTYVSSWCFDPVSRDQPELVQHLHDLFCVINVLSHTDPQKEIRVACGIPRLKTDQYIANIIGYERSSDEQGALPEVQQSNLDDEPVVLLTLENGHPFTYRRRAKDFEMIWKERSVLHSSESAIEKKKAA